MGKSLDSINGEILSSFPNLKLGTSLLQQALTTLVQNYHRFIRVLGVAPLSQIPATAQLINIHQLMVEVKRYKPSFWNDFDHSTYGNLLEHCLLVLVILMMTT